MRSTHWWKRSVCPAIFDRDRAALDPTRVVEPPARACGRPLTFRQRCAVAEEPDNWSLRLLWHARRERPRHRRAAEKRDERAARQMRRPMFEHRPPPALLVEAYRILSLPPSGGRVLGADLNRSE